MLLLLLLLSLIFAQNEMDETDLDCNDYMHGNVTESLINASSWLSQLSVSKCCYARVEYNGTMVLLLHGNNIHRSS